MKKKLSKIMGIGFALVLVASLLLFAVPASAGAYENLQPEMPNMWRGFPPQPGLPGAWFFDPNITKVGPIAQAINGDIYAYVQGTAATPDNPLSYDIAKSTDGGRTWTFSQIPFYYGGGAVVDMVCSSMSEDVLYLTDGNYVYRSINGGLSFDLVAAEDLEFELEGACGVTISTGTGPPITCIDLAYDGAGTPIVFIGTKDVGVTNTYVNPNVPIVGSVYWIADQTFSADWKDLQLRCYGCCNWPATDPAIGCYDVFAVAGAPDFPNQNKAYAVVSGPLTSITFPASSTAEVEIRAGDGGASVTYTGWTGVATYAGTDTPGADPDTLTMNAYEVATWTGDGGGGGTITVAVASGTISWRVDTTVGTADATFCGGTFAIRTLGTVCAWNTVSEIKWNCSWSFQIKHASRIMFPSFYATEPTLFVGVTAVTGSSGEGGDVYRVADTLPIVSGCIDLNVQGFMTGCQGLYHANICSLDIENDQLVAGAYDSYQLQTPTRVYYSADGGWTWSPSLKDPTGAGMTYVLFASSVVAATEGCNCAFSLDCGANPAQFFNQISLIDMAIDQVLDLTHSPEYVVGSSTMFALTNELESCYQGENLRSLLRWDGTFWDRVHSSLYFNALTQAWVNDPLYDWVEASPDFNSTSCLYMANTGFYMTRSLDAGCSWNALIYPCLDRPDISAWIVVDEETVLAAGGGTAGVYNGSIYRTINHGAQPWSTAVVKTFLGDLSGSGVDFDLSVPRGPDSDVLFGDADGQVFISHDLGTTWIEIKDAVTGLFGYYSNHSDDTYVVFDPGYGTVDDPGENMIYAAAGDEVGRCNINSAAPMHLQDWVYISDTTTAVCVPFTMYEATGIDAHGDTVLYVSDAGYSTSGTTETTIEGTIGVRYTCADPTLCTCDLTINSSDYDTLTLISGGPFQLHEPLNIIEYNLFCYNPGSIHGDFWVQGLISGAIGYLSTVDEDESGCGSCTINNGAVEILYSSLQVTAAPTSGDYYPTGVWRTLNPMDWMTPVDPLDKVEWDFLSLGTPHELRHPEADSFSDKIYPDDLWLTVTANSNVLWALDLSSSSDLLGVPYRSYIYMWDDPLARQVVQVQPADGALLATTTTATLEWTPLDLATLYEVLIFSFCATCPDNMVIFDSFTTNLTCIVVEGLTPGTTYFWQVRVACAHPFLSKWSDLHSFDTALGAVPYLCSPWCGQDDVVLTTNFSWDPVIGATGYEIQIVAASADGTADWTGATTYTSVENAFASIPGLEYSTVYYWRVRSVKDGIYSAWAVCLFTTMDAPVEPPEPPPAVVVEQTEITPVWIWVIIGIGGALTIAVVILIVTTRKVP